MAAESPVRCSLVVESEPSALGRPCRQILSALQAKGFSQDDMFAVHLALEEAFLNAVKHGNKMDSTKKVTVEYAVDQEKVEICITDEGEGFDPGVIPDPRVGREFISSRGPRPSADQFLYAHRRVLLPREQPADGPLQRPADPGARERIRRLSRPAEQAPKKICRESRGPAGLA